MARGITIKQKKFADRYLETGNATEAVLGVYKTKNKRSATSIGSENLTKPDIKAYLEGEANGAATRIVKLSQSAKSEVVKLNANKDILDRAGYKPTDKVEATITFDKMRYERAKQIVAGRTGRNRGA